MPRLKHCITSLASIRWTVLSRPAKADPDLGFMARLMALCSLPRTNPGDRLQYKRVNGPYQLYMIAGGGNKLPFGNIPRLLLAWVSTEAVRTQSRELTLGRSLSGFMHKLGIYAQSGGRGGVRTRLRNQMDRLFHCTVQLVFEDERSKASMTSPVASRTELWWDPKHPDEQVLWESKIRLGEEFFNEIISHPVPLDMNTLKALTRSPLGLDLYMWLTYRTFALQSPLRLSWRQLYRQFGAHPDKAKDKFTVRDFRRKALRELGKIKTAWPDLNYTTARGVLVLLAFQAQHRADAPPGRKIVPPSAFNGPRAACGDRRVHPLDLSAYFIHRGL